MTTTLRMKPQRDYRKLNIHTINTPEFRHVWLLLFWPVYWLRFPIVEAINPPARCFLITSALDQLIPFSEYFVVAYILWQPMICLMALYLMVYDVEAFRKYSKFLIISVSASTLIYLLFPTMQNLRPTSFERDTIFTKLVQFIYASDTPTNVCPSEHVIGSIAFCCGALHSRCFRTPAKRTAILVLGLLTAISTVFLKQHTVIDLFAAVPLCLIVYWIVYRKPREKK